MTNGNDLIEFEEKNHERLHKAFLEEFMDRNKKVMDDAYNEYVEQEYSEDGRY